jgi:hypothetical protein
MASPCLPPIASGFVRKLYSILNGRHAAIIDWNEWGTAFSVFDIELLVERVLPLYFRGRLDAFRQQLREHGFQRIASSHHVAAQNPAVETYRHAHFLRGNPSELSSIVRTPLPRKRTRRKKPVVSSVAIKVEVKTEGDGDEPMVKAEPLPLSTMVSAMEDVDELNAGNSANPLFTDDERFDILQWLELPAVDAQPSLSSSFGSLDELDLMMADGECDDALAGGAFHGGAEHLTDEQVDAVMRILRADAGLPERNTMRSPAWDGWNQFSEDTLHSMVEWFST